MEDFKKTIRLEMESMKERLDKYQNDFHSKKSITESTVDTAEDSFVDHPSPAAIDAQKTELEEMQLAYTKLKDLVDSALVRLAAAERKMDNLEQYSRSNCLIVHGCKDIPKAGKYLETEEYICKTLNKHLTLDSPLQISDLDIAHVIPAKKGTPIIIKFLRRFQRNEIYAKKRFLKNTGMVITES